MIVIAVAGAAVLALVSWACLREAHRMSRSFIPDGGAPAVAAGGPRRGVALGQPETVVAAPAPALSRIHALGDATVPGADNDEALAAAAALWQVVVQTERV